MNKNNSSGYPGVSFIKSLSKYRAAVSLYGEKISLGYFSSPSVAAQAREAFLNRFSSASFPLFEYLSFRFPSLTLSDQLSLFSFALSSYPIRRPNLSFFAFVRYCALSEPFRSFPSNFPSLSSVAALPPSLFNFFVRGLPFSQIQPDFKSRYQNLKFSPLSEDNKKM